MESNTKTARWAGFIYLIVVITGFFSLMYVPTKLIEWKNPEQTFNMISASKSLFSLSIASSILCYIAFTLLPLVLYKLLKNVNGTYAKVMVIMALISVPISFINLQSKLSVLTIIEGADYLKIYKAEELQAQVMMLLKNYNNGILIVQIFWGLWLYPFGYLVYKSGFLPKILGIFLMLGCFGYILNVFGRITIPEFSSYPIAGYITLPASIGEIGICLWLLIAGVKNKSVNHNHQN
ncbi:MULTISPECIES: DUF4386 domain-containing protein [unclassified Chryseobacterium]|uniref:DUF4386 domain-containing protein n=1 Tax=unclassified Chryseobacterium TaxID=2593645 RepID=UPI00100A5031|nr:MULTISPECIES: DUF4386 domain-containing protein [unclassified Chryseobacterium]RXM53759.1 hypothetical protein BOQ64_05340 [Chryseobacterium sp. CH25]RXM63353.1 hypothetical protein BOQ60_15340 [Chryseobacterium sp. CH1]